MFLLIPRQGCPMAKRWVHNPTRRDTRLHGSCFWPSSLATPPSKVSTPCSVVGHRGDNESGSEHCGGKKDPVQAVGPPRLPRDHQSVGFRSFREISWPSPRASRSATAFGDPCGGAAWLADQGLDKRLAGAVHVYCLDDYLGSSLALWGPGASIGVMSPRRAWSGSLSRNE